LEKPVPLKGYAEALAKIKQKGLDIEKKEAPSWSYLVITDVVFSAGKKNAVYLVTNKGVYISEDDAHTWCLLDTGTSTLFEVGSLWISDANPQQLFVGTSTKVKASNDGGCHFHDLFDAETFMRDHGQIGSR
jgi:hypothetical protein